VRSIPPEIVREIKERVDIVSIISNYVSLKRAGATFKGLCPFHSEKTSSFNVHPDKKIFHCFGCGVGGDVISFLRKIENKSFIEVIDSLAQKACVDIERFRESGDGSISFRNLYEAHLDAIEIYSNALSKDQAARDYLNERGLTAETISTFKIGYAPDSWDFLKSKLLSKSSYKEEELLSAGLLKTKKENSGSYDYFRGRIMVPIHSHDGKAIAFGGRILTDSQPKYLNSPETPLFVKGNMLFNLHRAVPERNNGVEELILVEGYLDVISLHQAGFTNVVAPLGTALTGRQVKLLEKRTKKLFLGYDPDAAGIRATLKAINSLRETDIEVVILNLPAGCDPDDVIKKDGPAGIRKAIDTAVRIEEYLSASVCNGEDLSTSHEKERVLRKLMPLFGQLPSIVSKQNLIRILADKLDISEEVIRKSLMSNRTSNRTANRNDHLQLQSGASPALNQRPVSAKAKSERLLVCCLLNCIELFQKFKDQIDLSDFEDPFCKKIIQELFSKYSDCECNGSVYDDFLNPEAPEDDPQNRFITKEVLTNEITDESAPSIIEDALRTLKKQKMTERKKLLLKLIKNSSNFNEQKKYANELKEISSDFNNI
jgi:DNA primase